MESARILFGADEVKAIENPSPKLSAIREDLRLLREELLELQSQKSNLRARHSLSLDTSERGMMKTAMDELSGAISGLQRDIKELEDTLVSLVPLHKVPLADATPATVPSSKSTVLPTSAPVPTAPTTVVVKVPSDLPVFDVTSEGFDLCDYFRDLEFKLMSHDVPEPHWPRMLLNRIPTHLRMLGEQYVNRFNVMSSQGKAPAWKDVKAWFNAMYPATTRTILFTSTQ